MTPVLMMVTDRRRTVGSLPERVRAAARAGVHLIQIREPDLEGREYVQLAKACIEAVDGTGARVLINDRLDVAMAAGASGVHLRADSVPAGRACRLLPHPALIGRSLHDPAELEIGSPTEVPDYLVFGTVFPTRSKPGRREAGIHQLRSMVNCTPIPVLAIGGVTADTAGDVASTGAAGLAAISLFRDAPLPSLAETVVRLRDAWARGARAT